jgi:hypothetical protein
MMIHEYFMAPIIDGMGEAVRRVGGYGAPGKSSLRSVSFAVAATIGLFGLGLIAHALAWPGLRRCGSRGTKWPRASLRLDLLLRVRGALRSRLATSPSTTADTLYPLVVLVRFATIGRIDWVINVRST